MDAVPQDSYVLGNDNKLYRVNSTVNLKPFRAYFTIADATETNIRINFDGEPTAINSVDVPATDNIYHNIAGECVETVIPECTNDEDNFDKKIRSFIDAIEFNLPSPVPTSQIIYNQAIIDGIARSSDLGREVTIEIPEI